MGKKLAHNLNLGISIGLPVQKNINYNNLLIKNNSIPNKIFKNFNSLQIMFTKTKLSDLDMSNILQIIKKINYKYIYIHASYQINIGAEPLQLSEQLYNPSLDILFSEINSALKIGASGIVIHMGKNVKKMYEHDLIYNNMINYTIQLFNKISEFNILKKNPKFVLLFETPAGAGGEMCSNINDFVNFILTFNKTKFYSNIGICIDTCHIFQAGYDLNNKNIIKHIHKEFEPVKDKIKLIHLNDSYNPSGMRIDRHEQIGKGFIKTNNLIKFIFPYKNLPLILETTPPYEEQLKKLKK